MAELSRQELLAWLNDLLQFNYTKVEQCGTGAAIVQIFDSIYQDVPLQKVKFNTNQEYEYVNNFKILQSTFTKHKVNKVIPVERLVKCKFQDNLEFLQWVKKYWDTHYPGGDYEAIQARRATSAGRSSKQLTTQKTAAPLQKSAPTQSQKSVAPKARAQPSQSNQVQQMQLVIDGLEKERNFYFNKLRDVETMVQARQDAEGDSAVGKFCEELSQVLYATEDGFALPDENLEEETF